VPAVDAIALCDEVPCAACQSDVKVRGRQLAKRLMLQGSQLTFRLAAHGLTPEHDGSVPAGPTSLAPKASPWR
jgi:hypothetical protein